MSTTQKSKESNKNNFKNAKVKKPLGDLKLNIHGETIASDNPPRSSKNENDENNKSYKIFKRTLQDLCKNEMKSILNIPDKRPQSANSIGQREKFNFDILEEKGNGNTDKKIKSDINKIKQVSVVGKENKPQSVIVLEKEWEERRLNRQRLQLEGQVSCRQRLRSEGSFTKFDFEYKPIQSQYRKPIRTLVNDNIQRINTRRVSPIRPNRFTSESVLISAITNLPKLRRRDSSKDSSSSCNCDLSKEMTEDILKMGKIQEKKILLPNFFLIIFNNDPNYRCATVNWMLWLQNLFPILDSELYIAVSLLDQVLARIAVPKNMYQLVAMACISLSNKFGNDNIREFDLLEVMNNVYDDYQLSYMERKIFKLLDFSIHSIEPSVFVNAYLILANLDPQSGKYFEIFFCLDHAVHLASYSSTPTSLVVLAAMSVAFNTFKNANLETIVRDLKRGLKQDEDALCIGMERLILGHIKKLNEPKNCVLRKYKNCAWIKLQEDQ